MGNNGFYYLGTEINVIQCKKLHNQVKFVHMHLKKDIFLKVAQYSFTPHALTC